MAAAAPPVMQLAAALWRGLPQCPLLGQPPPAAVRGLGCPRQWRRKRLMCYWAQECCLPAVWCNTVACPRWESNEVTDFHFTFQCGIGISICAAPSLHMMQCHVSLAQANAKPLSHV
jgi:hypothetical protein